MDTYIEIENIIASKYGKDTTTKKAIGDFMLSDTHAVNVKSNNIEKQNYSPNMISIKKMHKWVFEEDNDLSFIFVDYRILDKSISIIKETEPILIQHISWECLTIEAQGYGVIQKHKDLVVDKNQSKKDFYKDFLKAYNKYREKEINKHKKFSERFIRDIDNS